MNALDILAELRDSLPPSHHERAGLIRAIEVLRSDADDLEVDVTAASRRLLTADELSRLAEYGGEVWNATLDDREDDDPADDSNDRALARVALEIVERVGAT